MQPETFLDGKVTLYCGDCLEVLDTLPDNSIDGACIDPPYHLASIVERFGGNAAAPAQHGTDGAFKRASAGFMGMQWDGGDVAFRPETWVKVLRVLKPGAHLFCFTASKQVGEQQRAIMLAGFEQTRDVILDMIDADSRVMDFLNSLNDAQRMAFFAIMEEGDDVGGLMAWIYGTGFPKNHNVALDYEKRLCRVIERDHRKVFVYLDDGEDMARKPPFRHPLANEFAGFGSALKPAFEPIIMARKPLIGSIAENVEAFGCGALNIDAARIGETGGTESGRVAGRSVTTFGDGLNGGGAVAIDAGRYPANVVHDSSDAVLNGFPKTPAAKARVGDRTGKKSGVLGEFVGQASVVMGHDDDGGTAARFFFSAKADAHDRVGSKHPTVKPVDLIQWLVRLGTAPGAVILDCFAGTGTLGEAAFREGRRAILIEREPQYQADIRRRMALCLAGPDERARESIKAKTKGDALSPLPLFG